VAALTQTESEVELCPHLSQHRLGLAGEPFRFLESRRCAGPGPRDEPWVSAPALAVLDLMLDLERLVIESPRLSDLSLIEREASPNSLSAIATKRWFRPRGRIDSARIVQAPARHPRAGPVRIRRLPKLTRRDAFVPAVPDLPMHFEGLPR
jgi:hypothetical protein